MPKNTTTCPCGSGKTYQKCCELYHLGQIPENAEILMRSRYSAYALQKADYIMDTTHPLNPHFQDNRKKWKEQILAFAKATTFEKLHVLKSTFGETESSVAFTAFLRQGNQDCTFTEESRFKKLKGRWLYLDGQIRAGK